jgi:hypothetical protein
VLLSLQRWRCKVLTSAQGWAMMGYVFQTLGKAAVLAIEKGRIDDLTSG